MNCPNCSTQMKAELNLTGGCSGHSGDWEDRCYCDSPDVNLTFQCPNVKCTVLGSKKKSPRSPVRISDLSDQYSIAEWITKNYKVSEDTKIY